MQEIAFAFLISIQGKTARKMLTWGLTAEGVSAIGHGVHVGPEHLHCRSLPKEAVWVVCQIRPGHVLHTRHMSQLAMSHLPVNILPRAHAKAPASS